MPDYHMSPHTKKTAPPPKSAKSSLVWYILLFALLLITYHNSFRAAWHFDDIGNILLNTPLHITSLDIPSLSQTVTAYPGHPGKLFRPISNLSFGINWFFAQDNVFSYHIINFIIHFLSAVFLFKSCLLILDSPKITTDYKKNSFVIAAITTLLWALNPVQTQAVIYIVQRMAQLVTLFSIAGIWCYLTARSQHGFTKKAILYSALCVLAFLLALGSKENGILFPASILLIELIFFQKALFLSKRTMTLGIGGLALIVFFALTLVGFDFFTNIVGSYQSRDFTLLERVLTEARILFIYLGQLLYPSPMRLSITHDIVISRSLFFPATTFPALLGLSALTACAVAYRKRLPLLSFAILFFLLNHLVESSIIPLELFFEHRNYLPSLFLFLPLAAGFSTILEKYRHRNRVVFVTIISGMTLVLIFFSLATIARNRVWLTEKSLWSDSLAKAPKTARSYINLSHEYLVGEKNYKKAFELAYRSLDKYSPTPWKEGLRAYNIMGLILTKIGKYDQALVYQNKALHVAQKGSQLESEVLFQQSRTLWLAGRLDKALENAAKLSADYPKRNDFLRFYGELNIISEKIPAGIAIFKRVISQAKLPSQEYSLALLDLSLAYGRTGALEKSRFYLSLAGVLNAPAAESDICKLELSIRSGLDSQADLAFSALLTRFTWPVLMATLKKSDPERPSLPIDHILLQNYAAMWLTKQITP